MQNLFYMSDSSGSYRYLGSGCKYDWQLSLSDSTIVSPPIQHKIAGDNNLICVKNKSSLSTKLFGVISLSFCSFIIFTKLTSFIYL